MKNRRGRGFLYSITCCMLSCLSWQANAAYYLELGAFRNQTNAKKMFEKAKSTIKKNITVDKSPHGKTTLYFVKAGPFETLQEVNDAKRLATQAKLPSFVFNHKPIAEKFHSTHVNSKSASHPANKAISQPPLSPAILISEVGHYYSQDNEHHIFPIIYNDFAYFIQLGEYKRQTEAEKVYMSVCKTLKIPSLIIGLHRQADTVYRVQIGPFATRSKANSYRKTTTTELALLTNIEEKYVHSNQSEPIKMSSIPKLPKLVKLNALTI